MPRRAAVAVSGNLFRDVVVHIQLKWLVEERVRGDALLMLVKKFILTIHGMQCGMGKILW
jgi:hypothetical protein